MGIFLMFAGIFGTFLSIFLENIKATKDCRTLWDVHQTYMWHAISILTLLISLVLYFFGLNMAV